LNLSTYRGGTRYSPRRNHGAGDRLIRVVP
jgi:hypothetical protein